MTTTRVTETEFYDYNLWPQADLTRLPLDVERCREDFPVGVKDWAHMNIAERDQFLANLAVDLPLYDTLKEA